MPNNEYQAFWDAFNRKNFDLALRVFETFTGDQKQALFAVLFQKSGHQQTPHSISVLFRELHEHKQFADFHTAWLPADEHMNTEQQSGQEFHQFFPVPVRVINGVNLNNPKEIVSVGLHWLKDEEVPLMMEAAKSVKNSERGESIAKVANQTQSGIYMVKSDDSLGTPFETLIE